MTERHQGLLEGGGMREGGRDPKWHEEMGLDELLPVVIVVLVSQRCVCVCVCVCVYVCV